MKNYVFCKNKNKPNGCIDCKKEKCPSLCNIFGIVLEFPIIKQIDKYICDTNYDKYLKEEQRIIDKYGYCENDDYKLMFGIKSYDDLSIADSANIYTMNDLEVIYNKKDEKYCINVESIYIFDNELAKNKYIINILNKFTKYMEENNFDTNFSISWYEIFSGNIGFDCKSDSIEETYARFKFIVNGYINMNKGEDNVKTSSIV